MCHQVEKVRGTGIWCEYSEIKFFMILKKWSLKTRVYQMSKAEELDLLDYYVRELDYLRKDGKDFVRDSNWDLIQNYLPSLN